MIIAGGLLIALGIGSTIYGFQLNSSIEAQLGALFGRGSVDPGTGWITIGILMLVVGIILVFFGMTKKSPPKSLSEVVRPVIDVAVKACPHCGKKLVGSPDFCPYCGKSTVEKKSPAENVCPYCESIIPTGAAFCPACGKRVGGEYEAADNPSPKPDPDLSGPAESVISDGWSIPDDSDL